jgi:hypothetical protein
MYERYESVLPATLDKLFRPVLQNNSAAEEKIRPLFEGIFSFRNKTVFVFVSRKIIIVLGLAYSREKKIGKTILGHFCNQSDKIQP